VLCVLLFGLYCLEGIQLKSMGQSVLVNWGFLLLQLLLVSVYFSLKERKWMDITKYHLGWGDIVFLLCPGIYLSSFTFLGFYVFSLALILLFYVLKYFIDREKIVTIPLAGLQALLFGLLLAAGWWLGWIVLHNDQWLLNLINA
jgi:hypothetical protein